DNITFGNAEIGDVYSLAIHKNMIVFDELVSFSATGGKAQEVNHVIKAGFQTLQQSKSGFTFGFRGICKIFPELSFENSVIAFSFLFFAKLKRVLAKLHPRLTVLSRRISASFKSTFVCIASIALQKELHAFSATKLALTICNPTHFNLSHF